MTTEINTWQIVDGSLREIKSTLAQQGRTEAFDLESWIVSNPAVIDHDLAIIGRQVSTKSGPLDLLGIDKLGNLVIVELKRDRLPREALAQAIDYASDVSSWSLEKIGEICLNFNGKSLEDTISESFEEENLDTLDINANQRIMLVGFSIESALERMVTWLSENYGMAINAVVLHYVATHSGDELLTRTSLISEEIAKERIKQRKFKIPMSDKPGQYETEELREQLVSYLSQEKKTPRRIKEILIPLCLSHEIVQRDLLKEELVRRGEAEDAKQAGFSLSVISSQIGVEKNDFLRQVIGYGYPNHPWMKDNYVIRPEYRELLKGILEQL